MRASLFGESCAALLNMKPIRRYLKKLIQAADEGDWASYNELMGGMICPGNQRPIRPMLLERKETNRYGEAVKVIKGLLFGSLPMITRSFE
ncbi:MAG: hypothetical protein AB9Q19_14510 [Candidatus Reddybacter sp.]